MWILLLLDVWSIGNDKEEQIDINITTCDLGMCLLTYIPLELIKYASFYVYFLLELVKHTFPVGVFY